MSEVLKCSRPNSAASWREWSEPPNHMGSRFRFGVGVVSGIRSFEARLRRAPQDEGGGWHAGFEKFTASHPQMRERVAETAVPSANGRLEAAYKEIGRGPEMRVMLAAMTISFPNQSRSYDPRGHCIRFWGHDDAREVAFAVEEDALTSIDRKTQQSEAGFLKAFDVNRDRIFNAARKVYSPRGGGFFILAASNF